MNDARKTRRDFLRPVPDARESEPQREPVAPYEPLAPKPIVYGNTAPYGTPIPTTSERTLGNPVRQPMNVEARAEMHPAVEAKSATALRDAPKQPAPLAPLVSGPPEAVPAARTPSGQLLKPGECFAGKYRIVSVLSVGPLARVYRAKQLPAERDVAVKVLLTRYAGRPEMRRAMEREGAALSRVQHPGIVTIHDIGSDAQAVWVVSEFLDGETARKRLTREGAFSLERAVVITLQAADAVAAAHDQGILHGDLKPENFFLTKDDHVKVVDFLTARFLTIGEDDDVRDEFAYATAEYAAPECFDPSVDQDERADVYSMALVFIELVTGVNPMLVGGRPAADTLLQLRQRSFVPSLPPEIPRQMVPVLLRALDKKPDRRQASTRDLARDLLQAYQRFLEDAEDVRPTWIDRWGPWLRGLRVGGSVGLAFGFVAFVTAETLGPSALSGSMTHAAPPVSAPMARSIASVAMPAVSKSAPTAPAPAPAPAPAYAPLTIPVPSAAAPVEATSVPAARASASRPAARPIPHTAARAPRTNTAAPPLLFSEPPPPEEPRSVATPAHSRPTGAVDVSSGL